MIRRRLLVLLPERALAPLDPLRAAWAEAGIEADLRVWTGEPPAVAATVAEHPSRADAALLIGPPRRAPSTMASGPFALDRDGRRVPVAWLPFRGEAELETFARGAARVHRRAGSKPAVALLAQWMPHYLRVVDRMRAILRSAGAGVFRWSGDALTRDDMLDALSSGLGLALYVGHGRPIGWVGYHGVRAHHFAGRAEPLGAVVSLCCRTASRKRTGLSYAEALPLLGAAGASFGAVEDTRHADNTRWAVGMCRALVEGVETLGDLVLRAAPSSPAAIAGYRILGDPLIPVRSAAEALERALTVRTYE